MNTADKLDMSIKKLLSQKAGDIFTINNKWLCRLKSDANDASWKKDVNSPAMNLELPVNVHSNEGIEDNLDGIVFVQSDMSLSRKYYASLYMKSSLDSKWKSMLSVVDIKFKDN